MKGSKWSTYLVSALAIAMAVGTVVATIKRIRLGVDYLDEAYYVALPYRFAMGDRPFVDELNIVQTSALFLYPFVKVYTMLRGTTGIFLFMRILFVTFCCGVGAAAYGLASTRVRRPAALLIAACCVAFIPYSVPALSYNTLGMGFLSIGLFTIARWLLLPPETEPPLRRHPLFWAGFALASSAFAYPPLAVPSAVAALVLLVLAHDERFTALGRITVGGVSFLGVVAPVLAQAGISHLRATMQFSTDPNAVVDRSARLQLLKIGWATDHPDFFYSLAIVGFVVLLSRYWPRLSGLLLLFLPWIVWDAPIGPRSGAFLSARYLAAFALHAPFLAFAVKDRRTTRILMASVWFPSAVAGFLAAWMSGNGATAAIVGLFPGVIVTAILAQMWLQESFAAWRISLLATVSALGPCVLLGCLVRQEWDDQSVYYDEQLPYLVTPIREGPYKGLHSSIIKERWLMDFSHDIQARGMGDRALFFYDFPGGYLIANRKPLSSSPWVLNIKSRCEYDARYFMAHATNGEMVVKVSTLTPTAVDKVVTDHCTPWKQKSGYAYCFVRGMGGEPGPAESE